MISNAIIRAPRILFLAAVLMLILGAGTTLIGFLEDESFGGSGWRRWAYLLQAVYQSISGAALPFFGAALLWRIDMKWFDKKLSSEAAE